MLYLRRMDEFEGTPVPGSEDAAVPFFSPDGQWVGFITASAIKKVPVEGGAVVKLASLSYEVAGASWGTDGYIYFSRFWAGVSRVPQNGGKVEIVTLPDPARQEQGHRWPEVLPDGDSVLFSIMKNFGANDAETGVLSIRTRTWRTVLPNASNAHYLSGHLVYVHGGTLMAVPFDLKVVTGNWNSGAGAARRVGESRRWIQQPGGRSVWKSGLHKRSRTYGSRVVNAPGLGLARWKGIACLADSSRL